MVLLSDNIRIFFLFIFDNSCWQAIIALDGDIKHTPDDINHKLLLLHNFNHCNIRLGTCYWCSNCLSVYH